MLFHDFLKSFKTKKKFSSVRELFEALGGEKKLGTSLRNFQLIESGTRSPTERVFLSIFKQLPREEYKSAVLAYFRSHVESPQDETLVEYLEQHLSPAYNLETRSLFETGQPVMTYSPEQLEALSSEAETMRLHHRMFLWEKLAAQDLEPRKPALERLVKLDLAVTDSRGDARPSRPVFRVPGFENSPPPTVRKSTNYFYSVLRSYISEEGSMNQQISFALQLVTPTVAQTILEQMTYFKRWVQSVASSEPRPDLVPFLFVSFGKKLEDREL